MQSQELLDAIDDYYKLKHKYEKKYMDEKEKIINNPMLSTKEKVQKYQQIKKVCIKCKQSGGTIFINRDNKLKALCGHKENPCKLNIDIDKGLYKTSTYLANILNETIDEEKSEIIRIKIDFLFGYISEERALELFNKLKPNLLKSSESLKNIETKYLNIVDNKEKKTMLETTNVDLHKNILEVKELYKNFESTKNNYFIKTLVELYISDMLEQVKTIRNLKYEVNDIETSENDKEKTIHLIQKPYTISSLEVQLVPGKVNFNKK